MNRLAELRENSGLNMKEVAEKMGMPYTTYRNYETGQRGLNSELLIQFSEFYDVPIDYILCRDRKTVVLKLPIVQKYEMLDEIGKRAVESIIDIELERVVVEEEKPKRIVTLFAAAAGPGDYTDGEPIETWEDDTGKADFAVRVSGDSMEPYFHNGDVLPCKTNRDPKAGDIAVVMVNGAYLVKQFFPGIGRQFYLRSLNRERSDNDYDYIPSGNDFVTIFGVVVCDKIPMVDQYGM